MKVVVMCQGYTEPVQNIHLCSNLLEDPSLQSTSERLKETFRAQLCGQLLQQGRDAFSIFRACFRLCTHIAFCIIGQICATRCKLLSTWSPSRNSQTVSGSLGGMLHNELVHNVHKLSSTPLLACSINAGRTIHAGRSWKAKLTLSWKPFECMKSFLHCWCKLQRNWLKLIKSFKNESGKWT